MLTFRISRYGAKTLQRVAQFLERLVDQLDVAAVGLVAQKLQRVGDDLADQIAVGNFFQGGGKLFGDVLNFIEIFAAERDRRLGGLLRLLDCIFRIFIFLHFHATNLSADTNFSHRGGTDEHR